MRIANVDETDVTETRRSNTATSRLFTRRRIMAAIVIVALLVGLAYLAVCGHVATQLTKPQRYSQVTSPAAYGLEFEQTAITARDGLSLAGWFIPSPGSTRALLLVHGKGRCRSCEFDGRFVEFASRVHAEGFNLLMIDLRAHGQSEGHNFTFGDQERWDVLGAVDWLQSHGFDNIGVLGVSLGAASSAAAASDPESGHLIDALVLDSSFSDLHGLLRARFTEESGLPNLFLPGSLFMARALMGVDAYGIRPADDVAQTRAPLMFIFGGQDELVPSEQFLELTASRPDAETWFVDDAAHARIYTAEPEQYVVRVAEFFDNSLR